MPPADDLLVLLLVVLILGGKKAAASSSRTAPAPAPAAPPATSGQVKPGDLLVPGATYRAVISLSGIEAMFGTAAAVKAKLEGAGFQSVKVTDKGSGSFEATGKWGGAAVPAKLPSQVKSVWRG